MNTRKGFSLIEVVVALTIFSIGILIVLQLFSLSGKLIIENKRRVEAQSMLLSTLFDCANSAGMPFIVQGRQIKYEFHHNVQRFKTFFGPIDVNSLQVKTWHNGNWVAISPIEVYESGAVNLHKSYETISVSYILESWNYIREKRRNVNQQDIYLSYPKVDVKYVVTDTGYDVPLSDLRYINTSKGIIQVVSHEGEWLNFYYNTPKDIECIVSRADIRDYTVTDNILSFSTPDNLENLRIKIIYEYFFQDDTLEAIEFHNILNHQIILKHNPTTVKVLRVLSIKGTTLWELYGSETQHKETYIMTGN